MVTRVCTLIATTDIDFQKLRFLLLLVQMLVQLHLIWQPGAGWATGGKNL